MLAATLFLTASCSLPARALRRASDRSAKAGRRFLIYRSLWERRLATPAGSSSSQKTGQIFIVDLPAGKREPDSVSRSSRGPAYPEGNEQGLLGLAFDPEHATNGRFYVNYTAPGRRLRRRASPTSPAFNVTPDPDIADPSSEATVLTFDQPQTNHNGGWIGFSPRARRRSQSLHRHRRRRKRQRPGTGPYRAGRQLAKHRQRCSAKCSASTSKTRAVTRSRRQSLRRLATDKQEIFCFRPAQSVRCSFDRQTGDLYIGDVGAGCRAKRSTCSRPPTLAVAKTTAGGCGEGFIQNPAYPDDPVAAERDRSDRRLHPRRTRPRR